jgi:anaerobic selenocysteine-containing dehydrogenase
VCLLAMQAVGKPGVTQLRNWGVMEFGGDGEGSLPESIAVPDVSAASQGQRRPVVRAMGRGLIKKEELASVDMPEQFIPKTLIPEAILNPPISWYSTGLTREPKENQFQKYDFPAEGCSEIHMIWTDTPCWITCWNNSNQMIKAFRSPKIEFILAQHPWLENDCQFADILLPVNTKFEETDIAVDVFGQFEALLMEDKCIEPRGESKSDYEVVCMIAERMGLLKEYTSNRSQEEWIKLGFDTSGLAQMTTYEEIKEKGYFVSPTNPNWMEARPGLRDFFENPEKYPIPTPSGKIEFYSRNLSKYFPDDTERPPLPHWVEKGESHDESLSSRRAQKYPLLIVSNHGRWRVHAQHDDINWTREIVTCKVKGCDGYLYEPVWIHPADAGKRGIKDGDIVKVFNERGGVLGGARVWERIMPGVVYMDHGARYDPVVAGVLDRGGAINTITPGNTTSKNAMGMATSGFLVDIERINIEELRKKYPEVFNRSYDPAAGLCTERVLL